MILQVIMVGVNHMSPDVDKLESPPEKVDFDDYADNYESILQDQLKGFSADRGYFSEAKINVMQRLVNTEVTRVLDYGCGIGLNLPYLSNAFPQAKILATDISNKRLSVVGEKYTDAECIKHEQISDLDSSLDLIFVAGVFHHIPPGEREATVAALTKLLKPGGQVFVFEHNPYNPLTRHMVNTCPFDEDAVLISRAGKVRLLRGAFGLSVSHSSYFLFFPYVVRFAQPFERYLGWLPLGGQYFVRAIRS